MTATSGGGSICSRLVLTSKSPSMSVVYPTSQNQTTIEDGKSEGGVTQGGVTQANIAGESEKHVEISCIGGEMMNMSIPSMDALSDADNLDSKIVDIILIEDELQHAT